jgi:hypothetical protein
MLQLWTGWIEGMRFAAEAQAVIAMRLMVFALGERTSPQEALRMVAEKIAAFSEAELAAAEALLGGHGPFTAAARAYAPVRRRVHANSRRLLAGMR